MASVTAKFPAQHAVPPLQNGDRLTRPEFERRFAATPNLKFAELIEGVVYMPPPISHEFHSRPHMQLCAVVSAYLVGTPGIDGGDSGSIRLDLDNMPQPDTYLFIEPARGGRVRISEDGYVEGAPEWIGEVSASTASYDLHAKLNVYRRNGVREYVVWRVFDKEIDWFMLDEGQYKPNRGDAAGILRSSVLPGFWLDAPALVRGDVTGVLRLLQQGLATSEHAEFVRKLQAGATQSKG